MRTQGTFTDVYAAAKNFSDGGEGYGGCPHDPVVRHTPDGIWMLESGLHSEPDADAECRLDDFDSWFCECYQDADYQPDEEEANFLDYLREEY